VNAVKVAFTQGVLQASDVVTAFRVILGSRALTPGERQARDVGLTAMTEAGL
jgi:hypothetical protein